MVLFDFLKKKGRSEGQIGIRLAPNGVAIARAIQTSDDPVPTLELCRYLPVQGEEGPRPILAQQSEELNLDQSPCITIAENATFTLLLVEAPQVESTELKSALRWRIKDLIDFDVDEAIIDAFDIPGQEERGRQKLMYVVAARRSAVQEQIEELEGEGINLSIIDIPELAMRNIAALLSEDESGVAMLHLNREGGLLTITRQKNLYLARRLDIGLSHLLAFSSQAPQHEEDDEFVLDEETEELPSDLQRAFDNIVLEVQRSLDYYESHFALPQVASLVIAPLEEPVPHLLSYLSSNLGVPVRMLDLNAVLHTEQLLSDELQSQCLLAIGAALRQRTREL